MLYPTNSGKSRETLSLTTLENVWIQGKLRMWGRWSYIGGCWCGENVNQCLVSKKTTATAHKEVLCTEKKGG
ncbi:DUF1133 family protein [Escherichia coli]|nr:DUF1133 family protein [Escherichia coli]